MWLTGFTKTMKFVIGIINTTEKCSVKKKLGVSIKKGVWNSRENNTEAHEATSSTSKCT